MKKITLTICLGLLSFLLGAQPRPFPSERMSDEEILQMQARDIVLWLDLDKQTEARFIKEYTAFRKEIDAIVKNVRPPQENNKEIEIDRAIQHNFAVSDKILQTRKKYYAKFKEFMKPSQIQMMYRIENEAGRRMHSGNDGRIGNEHGIHHMPPQREPHGPMPK